MRRVFMLLIVAGLLLVPLGAVADTQDTAVVSLTLQDVIDVSIVDELENIEVTQKQTDTNIYSLEALYKSADPIIVAFGGTFTIQIIALTNFTVALDYTAVELPGGGAVDPPLGVPEQLLQLTGGSQDLQYIPYEGGVGLDISNDFLGLNNTPGEELEYDLHVNLDSLGDRAAGEEIQFTVRVVVTDPTTA